MSAAVSVMAAELRFVIVEWNRTTGWPVNSSMLKLTCTVPG